MVRALEVKSTKRGGNAKREVARGGVNKLLYICGVCVKTLRGVIEPELADR
jgi:hypothetical protein